MNQNENVKSLTCTFINGGSGETHAVRSIYDWTSNSCDTSEVFAD